MVHVHTLLEWGVCKKWKEAESLREVTSVNVRHATWVARWVATGAAQVLPCPPEPDTQPELEDILAPGPNARSQSHMSP